MKGFFAKLDEWAKQHHPRWIDALRIILGLTIHLKALLFIGATAGWIRVLETYGEGVSSKFLVYVVGTASLLLGTMIMLGLQTRIVALIQIPVMMASIIYSLSHLRGSFLIEDLALSFLILVLLIFFFVEGSGKFSVDQYIRNSYKTYQPDPRKNDFHSGTA